MTDSRVWLLVLEWDVVQGHDGKEVKNLIASKEAKVTPR